MLLYWINVPYHRSYNPPQKLMRANKFLMLYHALYRDYTCPEILTVSVSRGYSNGWLYPERQLCLQTLFFVIFARMTEESFRGRSVEKKGWCNSYRVLVVTRALSADCESTLPRLADCWSFVYYGLALSVDVATGNEFIKTLTSPEVEPVHCRSGKSRYISLTGRRSYTTTICWTEKRPCDAEVRLKYHHRHLVVNHVLRSTTAIHSHEF